jgi:hypothetical protein
LLFFSLLSPHLTSPSSFCLLLLPAPFSQVFFASQQESREEANRRAKKRAVIDYITSLVIEKPQRGCQEEATATALSVGDGVGRDDDTDGGGVDEPVPAASSSTSTFSETTPPETSPPSVMSDLTTAGPADPAAAALAVAVEPLEQPPLLVAATASSEGGTVGQTTVVAGVNSNNVVPIQIPLAAPSSGAEGSSSSSSSSSTGTGFTGTAGGDAVADAGAFLVGGQRELPVNEQVVSNGALPSVAVFTEATEATPVVLGVEAGATATSTTNDTEAVASFSLYLGKEERRKTLDASFDEDEDEEEEEGKDGEEVKEGEEVSECVVCAELVEFGSVVTLPQCSHTFHAPCILRWLQERPR